MNCPVCKHEHDDAEVVSEAAAINGRKKSTAKAMASRANGKKGGRPRKEKTNVAK